MYLFAIPFLCHLSWGLPNDNIIQIQHSGLIGGAETVQQVLVNGELLTSGNNEVLDIIQAISPDAPLRSPDVKLVEKMNRTPKSKNHTLLRIRECVLGGSRLHLTDRVLYDGKVYLTLNRISDVWTARSPQALALEELWNREPRRTRNERLQLQEGCVKLMKKLKLSEEKLGNPMTAVLVPVLALLVFIGLIIISLLISKNQGYPGAVIGSIVHYPQERKSYDYQTF